MRMKFVLLINLNLLTIANSFLLNIAEHKYLSAIVGIFIFISRESFMNWAWKRFITSGPDL